MEPARWKGMQVVNRGANRICVRDPDSAGHCLKYSLSPTGANLAELRAWRLVQPRLDGDESWRLAASEAIVQTPAGPALRCELVRDESGEPAPSLYQLLAGPALPDAQRQALAESVCRFEAWLQRQHIPLFDLNSGNLACVQRAGQTELVCIDLKSVLVRKELIPLARWSRRLMHAKIARRAARLRERILAPREAGH